MTSKKRKNVGTNSKRGKNADAPSTNSTKKVIPYIPPAVKSNPRPFRANEDQKVLIMQNLAPYLDHSRQLDYRYICKSFNGVLRPIVVKHLTLNYQIYLVTHPNRATQEGEASTNTSNDIILKNELINDNPHVKDSEDQSTPKTPNSVNVKDESTNDNLHAAHIEDETATKYPDESTDQDASNFEESYREKKEKVLVEFVKDTELFKEHIESIHLGKYAHLILENDLFATYCNLKSVKFAFFSVEEALLLQGLKHLNKLTQLEFQKLTVIGNGEAGPLHEPISLPSSITKLNMSNLRLKDEPNSFILTLTQHRENQELATGDPPSFKIHELTTSKLTHEQLIQPFFSETSDLTKLEFCIDNQLDSNDIMLRLCRANPSISDLHLRFKAIDQNIIDIIRDQLPELKSLTLTAFPKIALKGDRGWFNNSDISLNSPLQLTKLKLDSSSLTYTTVNNLLSKMPNLTKLYISVNKTVDYTAVSIMRNCPLLTWLTVKYPLIFQFESGDDRALSYLFGLEGEQYFWACARNLRVLTLVNLDILKFQPSYLTKFDNLEVINFYRTHKSKSAKERGNKLKEHMEKFKNNYFYSLHKSSSYRSGSLYKPGSTFKGFNLD